MLIEDIGNLTHDFSMQHTLIMTTYFNETTISSYEHTLFISKLRRRLPLYYLISKTYIKYRKDFNLE